MRLPVLNEPQRSRQASNEIHAHTRREQHHQTHIRLVRARRDIPNHPHTYRSELLRGDAAVLIRPSSMILRKHDTTTDADGRNTPTGGCTHTRLAGCAGDGNPITVPIAATEVW
uniref:hypothetical protein n=1 Tax=Nocardia donostiensis TaxID=1538463 RepID=UPI00111C440B|nr:hypothetical protein [Nocardia donostiensis]